MDTIESVKDAVRVRIRRDFSLVPSARENSLRTHLEVWETRSGRMIGIEFGHIERVNFWLTLLGLPRELPTTIERVDKYPKGRGWMDANGDGANSNLSAYHQFANRRIVRLGVKTVEDAMLVIDSLFR